MVASPGADDRTATSSPRFEAGYLKLLRTGALEARVAKAQEHLRNCDLCARYCRVDRLHSLTGVVCRTGTEAVVASYGAHHGEEDCLRGYNGSGTIFFSWCNLRCDFCQNWELSRKGEGRLVSADDLAAIMLELQEQGCHNINVVTPSHVVAQILEAVLIAARKGLTLPIVYNTGGYDSLEALALMDGVVDVYMPDLKYGSSAAAHSYSHVRNYTPFNQAAILEMHRQVGDLVIDRHGLAQRGLLVRHLILPNGIAGTREVLRFVAEEISPDTFINVMDQYRPCYKAGDKPEIARSITRAEYLEALDLARQLGLTRLNDPFDRVARV